MHHTDRDYIAKYAPEIAKLIEGCSTDYRGNFFKEIAFELRKNNQGFTANCIDHATLHYGIKND